MRSALIFAVLWQAAWPAQEPPTFHVDVDLATVACVVTDARGLVVRDLRRDEFRVFDGTVRQEVRNVWVDGELPLVVGVIIDASDSQRALARRHEITVEQFLGGFVRPADRAFVVSVNRDVMLRSEVIGGPRGLRHVVVRAGGEPLGPPCPVLKGRSLCGGTALWNAVFAAANLKLRRFPGSKALVILSDGDDTGSTRTLDEAVEAVRRAGGIVYAVKYPSAGRAGGRNLLRLTTETGGVLFDPATDEYRSVLAQIEKDLRSRYVIGFKPESPATESGSRRIRVEVMRPGLIVRVAAEAAAQ